MDALTGMLKAKERRDTIRNVVITLLRNRNDLPEELCALLAADDEATAVFEVAMGNYERERDE